MIYVPEMFWVDYDRVFTWGKSWGCFSALAHHASLIPLFRSTFQINQLAKLCGFESQNSSFMKKDPKELILELIIEKKLQNRIFESQSINYLKDSIHPPAVGR